jgi:drug/metabolite transporter (DMT)-like permease
MVIQNCILNKVCKKELQTADHVYRFNILTYIVCIILFGIVALSGGISLFTLCIGLLFGVVTAFSNYYKMLSLSNGPMHITLLITTSSMIIPTMSGIFFGETFSLPKLCVVVVLIFFIYLSLEKKSNSRINKRWLIFCSLAFIFQGSIGVLQKIHQSSSHKNETGSFLFIAFICSLVYSNIRAKKSFKALNFTKKHIWFALICGICTFGMNFLNLKLSGILPSQLFFPIVNGSAIILSSLMSILLFKEKLTKKQIIGLCGGLVALIAICLVK